MFGLIAAFSDVQRVFDVEAQRIRERLEAERRKNDIQRYELYLRLHHGEQKLTFDEWMQPQWDRRDAERRHRELMETIEKSARQITSHIDRARWDDRISRSIWS